MPTLSHLAVMAAAGWTIAAAPALLAQEPRLVIEPGGQDVGALIDATAQLLQRNYVVNRNELKSLPSPKIHVTSRIEAGRAGAEAVLAQVLDTCGLALVPLDPELGLWECLSMYGPRRAQIANRPQIVAEQDLGAPEHRWRYVCTTARLERSNAQTLTNSLRPFFAAGQSFAGSLLFGAVDKGTFLLAGLAPQVAGALDLVRVADLAGSEPDAEVDRRLSSLEGRLRALRARQAPTAPAASGPMPKLVLAAGPQEIEKLIRESAQMLGRACLYDPMALRYVPAPPSVAERTELDAGTVEARVGQLLYGCGLVLTPVDEARNLWEWIGASGPRRGEIVARTRFVAPDRVQSFVALHRHVSTLLDVPAERMPELITKLRPAAMRAAPAGWLVFGQLDRSTLLLQGMAGDVQAALDLAAPAGAAGAESRLTAPAAASTSRRLAALEAEARGLEKERPAAASRPAPVQGRRFMLEPGDHNLADLLREADRFLKRTTAFDTAEVEGAQTRGGGPIRLQTLLELDELGCDVATSQLLATRGLALTPADAKGQRRCVTQQQELEPVTVTPDAVPASARLSRSVTTTLELGRVSAQNAANQLRPFFASGMRVANALTIQAKSGRAIEIGGPAEQVWNVLRLLTEIDQPQPESRPSLEQRLTALEARVDALERRK